jgi:UDP-3-O-[3-hydroxymyristoyl] glucosamine N-acyltransferase
MKEFTVAQIAEILKGKAEGNTSAVIRKIAGLREAVEGDLSFLANAKYAQASATTKASAVLVPEDFNRQCPAALIRVKNPDKAFAEIAQLFAPPPVSYEKGIHPAAVVATDAKLGKDVCIGPYCVIESGTVIGDNSILVAHVYVGHGTRIGNSCKLYPHVSIREYTQIGNRTVIHNGTVIGSDGFGYVQEGAVRKKIPQIGIVMIGDDVEIGANVTIDRARFGETRIGNGVKIDNLVQIAHNVIIGDNSVIVAQCGISGSTIIGERTVLAGQVGVVGHIQVGSDVIIGAQSGVTKDIPSKSFILGSPAVSYNEFTRLHAHLMRLPELKEKVRAIEEKLNKLGTNHSKSG